MNTFIDWYRRGRDVLAQGETGTNSKRPSQFIEGVYPTHAIHSDQCYLWGSDGKKYLDMIGALGANILGYKHPKVTEAVVAEIKRGGPSYSLSHPIEIEVAEKLQTFCPTLERVRFFKNGNDATSAAVRIARAYKRQPNIGVEGYHGCGDLWTSLTSPAIGVVDKFSAGLIDGDTYTYTISIVEPFMLDASDERRDYLARRIDGDSVTIFDEIVTGLRVQQGCVTNQMKQKPDLVCFGKALGNGFPISVVGGKKDVMNCGEYFLSTTFSGETCALAAAKAVLEWYEQHDVKDLCFYAQRFQNSVNEIFKPLGFQLDGYGTRAMYPTSDPQAQLVMQEACKQGILIGKAWFYTWAHMEHMNEQITLNVLNEVAQRVYTGKVKMEGKRPKETFKR